MAHQYVLNMQEIHLKRNWWILGLFLVASVGFAILIVYGITWPAIKEAQLGHPLSGGWSWPAIVIVDIGVIILAASLCNIPLVQLRMVFTDEGIKMPGVLRSTFIGWNDIRYIHGISNYSSLMKITTSNRSVIINKLYYQHPDELVSFIRAHASASCHLID